VDMRELTVVKGRQAGDMRELTGVEGKWGKMPKTSLLTTKCTVLARPSRTFHLLFCLA